MQQRKLVFRMQMLDPYNPYSVLNALLFPYPIT